jgi:hypothetical protein
VPHPAHHCRHRPDEAVVVVGGGQGRVIFQAQITTKP